MKKTSEQILMTPSVLDKAYLTRKHLIKEMGKRARAFAVEMWVTPLASRSTAAPGRLTRMASAA